jgi:N-acetylmuramoyl-L-alanine amidase
MRDINLIIIHEADTPTGVHFTVEDIDSWHVQRGFKRDDTYRNGFNPHLAAIGYHFVIYTDGSIHTGRQVAEVGAHCAGLNSKSIGVCLVGKGVYSRSQWDALEDLVQRLLITYPKAKVTGHCDCPTGIDQGKTCPDFNVKLWVENGFQPEASHVA